MEACKSDSRSVVQERVHIQLLCVFFMSLPFHTRGLCFREFMPSLDEFFAEAIEQADPANMVEDEYK